MRIFTDFRYLEKARATGVEVVETPRSVFEGLPEHVAGRIEFEAESLNYAEWAHLSAAGLELVPRSELLQGVRAVKEDAELEAISRAAAITNECFERLAEQPFVGRTEKELAWWIESLMHELGADGPAFPIIVAAGPNGAQPHATTSDEPIEAGTTVVVDAAARLGDYASDCTRTFATGELPDELAQAYDVVPARAARRARGVASGRDRPRGGRGRARRDRGRGPRRPVRPRPRPRARDGGARAARACGPRATTCSLPNQRLHRRARHLPARASAGSGSRIS